MTLRQKLTLCSLFLLGGAAVFWSVFHVEGTEQATEASSAATSELLASDGLKHGEQVQNREPGHANNFGAKSELEGPADPTLEAVESFFKSETASEALTALGSVSLDEDGEATANALKESLAVACAFKTYPTIDDPSKQELVEYLRKYCRTSTLTADDRDEVSMWNMAYVIAMAEEMEAQLQGLTLAQQRDRILVWIGNASNYLDLEAIKLVLGSSFYGAKASDRDSFDDLHNLGQHPAFRGEQGLDIQRSALTLLQCQEFVKCDADSILVLSHCLGIPGCEFGWDMNDILYNNHSPLESEQVMAVLDIFFRIRGV